MGADASARRFASVPRLREPASPELSIEPEAQTSQLYRETLRLQPIGAIIESAPRPGSSSSPHLGSRSADQQSASGFQILRRQALGEPPVDS